VRWPTYQLWNLLLFLPKNLSKTFLCGGSLQSAFIGETAVWGGGAGIQSDSEMVVGCRLQYEVISWYVKTTIYYVIFSSRSDRDLLNLEHRLVTIIAQNDPNPYIYSIYTRDLGYFVWWLLLTLWLRVFAAAWCFLIMLVLPLSPNLLTTW